ncbi:hypothetical protein FCIRC_7857 [Fusarium circinatum]|uniref:PD-(D/E)XK nuclease-like domain-containing protein n=1 Tax=Fusarium circinatum TaxID=48490 RepID=A0A8H5WXP6_FUSCI|nr:hypothetical protein FCIRC_7857 [Fusarium circinatum]
MKVLFLGASGSIGSEALRQCLSHPKITSVVAFVRRALPSDHPKLQTVMIKDFLKWSDDILLPHVDAAAMICAMGSYRGNVNVDIEYPLAFQTALATLLEKQPKREPFRFIHLSGKWVVQEQDAKLWVNDYPRKLKGLYEIRSLEVAKEHAHVWKAWMLRPGGVITQRMRVPGYLAQVLLGDDYVIKNEELDMGSCNILTWLDTIPFYRPSTSEPKAKRLKTSHALSPRRLPTPPHDTMSSPTKRPRSVSDDGSDGLSQSFVEDDVTPKAPKRRGRLYHDISSASDVSSRSGRSSTSKASSPSKQQRDAAGEDTGYRVVSIERYEDWQPESLKEMRRVLENIDRGNRIVPASRKDEFRKTRFPEISFFDAASESSLPSGVDWRWPGMSWVDRIFDRAADYLEENEAEAGWNADIHAPILSWVFRKEELEPQFLDYMYCTSTQISSMYKPNKSKSKLVDYCIYMQPGRDSAEQAAIDKIRYRDRPSKSINHVDSGLLNKHPIVMSVETKRDGEDYTNAINQMATWHSAQLRSLCYTPQGPTRELSHIEFLPGIIVQGHDWNFVATIQRDVFRALDTN